MEQKWLDCQHFTSLMMHRRGYQETGTLNNNTDMPVYTRTGDESQILVWFFRYDKMNIESIKEFVHFLETTGIRHGLIVYQQTITSSTKKVIENLFQFKIELFEQKELLYDLTLFRYFCKHEKVDSKEASELKKKYGTSMPILLRIDPVVRYFDFQRGDIIRIYRRNNTLSYRLVK